MGVVRWKTGKVFPNLYIYIYIHMYVTLKPAEHASYIRLASLTAELDRIVFDEFPVHICLRHINLGCKKSSEIQLKATP